MSKAPTTQMSLRHLRELGYICEVVEKWVPSPHHGRNVKTDLFGFIDILAVGHGHTLGVQTTTKGEVAKRIRKIQDSEHLSTLAAAGWLVTVHGWWQPNGPRTRWELVEASLTYKGMMV